VGVVFFFAGVTFAGGARGRRCLQRLDALLQVRDEARLLLVLLAQRADGPGEIVVLFLGERGESDRRRRRGVSARVLMDDRRQRLARLRVVAVRHLLPRGFQLSVGAQVVRDREHQVHDRRAEDRRRDRSQVEEGTDLHRSGSSWW
jgi:hypothetical protein